PPQHRGRERLANTISLVKRLAGRSPSFVRLSSEHKQNDQGVLGALEADFAGVGENREHVGHASPPHELGGGARQS
ncbi:MAG: hypothetical protein C4340_05285, partial [Armatimonadota bacterium]